MLVQTINAIAIRYQNMRMGRGRDPLAGLELDPLRPLNNLLWGYLQTEHRRLSVVRRAYEYDHHYGLRLYGKAVPELMPADSRAKFLPAFHELLYQAYLFYKDDDIATVQADAFPIVNALRELHFVLTEGMQNQYGDLPSQARVEMLIQQWLLARPEIREFLRGRVMVPYPERWMDSVDTMKTLQGWTDVPTLYFNELAVTGEQLLLSARFADWSTQTADITEKAAGWARRHRSVVLRYMYAYKMATDVDLTVDRVEVQSPQARYGQPPIRTRVSSVPPPQRALPANLDDSLLGPPPADPRAASGANQQSGVQAMTLGMLVVAPRGREVFRYPFTPADVVWLGRLLAAASGGQHRGRRRAILWNALARFGASGRTGLSLAAFIERHEPSLPRVSWRQLPPGARRLALAVGTGVLRRRNPNATVHVSPRGAASPAGSSVRARPKSIRLERRVRVRRYAAGRGARGDAVHWRRFRRPSWIQCRATARTGGGDARRRRGPHGRFARRAAAHAGRADARAAHVRHAGWQPVAAQSGPSAAVDACLSPAPGTVAATRPARLSLRRFAVRWSRLSGLPIRRRSIRRQSLRRLSVWRLSLPRAVFRLSALACAAAGFSGDPNVGRPRRAMGGSCAQSAVASAAVARGTSATSRARRPPRGKPAIDRVGATVSGIRRTASRPELSDRDSSARTASRNHARAQRRAAAGTRQLTTAA